VFFSCDVSAIQSSAGVQSGRAGAHRETFFSKFRDEVARRCGGASWAGKLGGQRRAVGIDQSQDTSLDIKPPCPNLLETPTNSLSRPIHYLMLDRQCQSSIPAEEQHHCSSRWMNAPTRNGEDSSSSSCSTSGTGTHRASSTSMRTRIGARNNCQRWLLAAACLLATVCASTSSSSSAYYDTCGPTSVPKAPAFGGMGSDDSFFISSASTLPRAGSVSAQRGRLDEDDDDEEEEEEGSAIVDDVESYRAVAPVRRNVQKHQQPRRSRALDEDGLSAPPPPSASAVALGDEVAVEEEGYKARADWWKDPLAFFDDEEDADSLSSSSLAGVASDSSSFVEEEDNEAYYEEEDNERPVLRQKTSKRGIDGKSECAAVEEESDEEEEAELEVVGDYFDALEELRLPSLPAEEEEVVDAEPAPAEMEEIEAEEADDDERRELARERRDSRAAATPKTRRKVAKAAVTAGSTHHRQAATVSDAKTVTSRSRRRATSPRQEAAKESPASPIDVGGSVAVTAVPAVGLVTRFLPLPITDFFANQSGIIQAIGAILIVKQVVQTVWPMALRRHSRNSWGSTATAAHVPAAPHSRGGGGVTRTSKRRARGRGAAAEGGTDDTPRTRRSNKNRDDEINLDDESHESVEPASLSVDGHDAFTDVEDEEEDVSYDDDTVDSNSNELNPATKVTNSEDSKRASGGISSDSVLTASSHRVDNSAKGGGLVANAFRRVVFGMQPPPPQHLLDQVQELTDRCIQLDRLKGAAEGEYERVNLQLQQAQSELASLKQTTRYLQAQLRDNEETMERVVKSERRKAKAELARMKELMLQIVEREREAMREEFQKQAEELERMLMKEQEQHLQQRPLPTSTVTSASEANFTGAAVYHG
jgi:hypothetical protein